MAKTLQMNFADRVGDALFVALLRVGLKIGSMSLLTVRGRKSGQPRTVPVLLVEHDGHSFLVAPYGVVQWVRNIRAAGTATLTRGRHSNGDLSDRTASTGGGSYSQTVSRKGHCGSTLLRCYAKLAPRGF